MVVTPLFVVLSHGNGVFRYLCRILVGHGEACELTQEVFLRVARGPIPAADDAGRRAWVFRIARNLALNHVRDDRRRGIAVGACRESGAGDAGARRHAARRAGAAAGAGPRRFLMREAGGLSYDEIAVACELTADAVASRPPSGTAAAPGARSLLRARISGWRE